MRLLSLGLVCALAGSGCAGAGHLRAPKGVPQTTTCPNEPTTEALACYAPVLMQETAPQPSRGFDQPTVLDPDGSGTLADDFAAWPPGGGAPPAFYASARADAERLYLFYALYYVVDWSGPAADPHVDHRGDLEGALVVVSRAERRVEAVITQAHKRLYLWSTSEPAPRNAAGSVPVTESGRPLLFSESGGHGIYAFSSGVWNPKGGGRYPGGPAGVAPERLVRIDDVPLVPLDALRRYTRGPAGPFVGLPPGATPPWLWAAGPSSVPRGAIVSDPARLYKTLSERD